MSLQSMVKVRADQLLVDRNLAESRARAQALIMAGLAFVGDRRIDKPGRLLLPDTFVSVKGRDHPWVSRGGVKLAHALQQFGWERLQGCTVLDIGASTGGFTDVCLQAGAARVFAVDVGHGQLDWRLRANPRVVVLERVNARYLSVEHVPVAVDVLVCDASFIGLAIVLPAPMALTADGARMVALIKPQFEAGAGEVGSKGVVRDPAVHARVQAQVASFVEARPGWHVEGIVESPITGPEGNVEYLIGARRD